MSAAPARPLALLLLSAALAGCAGQAIQVVQEHHGHEFRCDRRYVQVERAEAEARWVSRGCGFEADWECRSRECRLLDSRAHGVDAP